MRGGRATLTLLVLLAILEDGACDLKCGTKLVLIDRLEAPSITGSASPKIAYEVGKYHNHSEILSVMGELRASMVRFQRHLR